MTALKLTQIGTSLGVILPDALVAQLKLVQGDTVWVAEADDGVTLSPHDPAEGAQMAAARRIMEARREVLRQLAK